MGRRNGYSRRSLPLDTRLRTHRNERGHFQGLHNFRYSYVPDDKRTSRSHRHRSEGLRTQHPPGFHPPFHCSCRLRYCTALLSWDSQRDWNHHSPFLHTRGEGIHRGPHRERRSHTPESPCRSARLLCMGPCRHNPYRLRRRDRFDNRDGGHTSVPAYSARVQVCGCTPRSCTYLQYKRSRHHTPG